MQKIIKCPHCKAIFFDIGNTICPHCGKDTREELDFLKDMFNLGD